MSNTMRAFLIEGLVKIMRTMTEDQARILADELTTQASAYSRRIHESRQFALTNIECLPSFPKENWNELTVGVPWEAYSYAHGFYKGKSISNSTQALCSAPEQLDIALAGQAMSSGLWGGSLLVALGKILEGVSNELVLFSPYWRTNGVQSLLAAAGRDSYIGVNVTIFSQPKIWMKAEDEEGLLFFLKTLREAGALTRVFAPRAHQGFTPILHAKLIIADRTNAYVGSANFTKSGLDLGLEAGVLLEGEAANAFYVWSNAIATTCEPW
jgi:phosphatidylserine/phosphatidylglycerophosphate/cardiolipin synthase-like enzyme